MARFESNVPTRYRVVLVGVATVILTMVGLFTVASPAAAASCYATSCNAKDPQEQGCSSSATTLAEFTVDTYRLELRYSSSCHAAWVRATSQGMWSYTNIFKLERDYPSSYFSTSFGGGEAGTKWTKMYSFTYLLRGSLYLLNISTGSPHGTWYTDWY